APTLPGPAPTLLGPAPTLPEPAPTLPRSNETVGNEERLERPPGLSDAPRRGSASHRHKSRRAFGFAALLPMPEQSFALTIVVRVLLDETEIAEALGFPELSCVGASRAYWQRGLRTKVRELLAD